MTIHGTLMWHMKIMMNLFFEVQFVGVLNTGFNPGFVDSGLFNDVRCKNVYNE